MTRRDYVLVSGALKSASERFAHSATFLNGIEIAADAIADALHAKNPGGFDKVRFMRDSGVA